MNNSDTQEIKGLEELVREEATKLRKLLKDPSLPQEKRAWILGRINSLESIAKEKLTKMRAANGEAQEAPAEKEL